MALHMKKEEKDLAESDFRRARELTKKPYRWINNFLCCRTLDY